MTHIVICQTGSNTSGIGWRCPKRSARAREWAWRVIQCLAIGVGSEIAQPAPGVQIHFYLKRVVIRVADVSYCGNKTCYASSESRLGRDGGHVTAVCTDISHVEGKLGSELTLDRQIVLMDQRVLGVPRDKSDFGASGQNRSGGSNPGRWGDWTI